MILKIRRFKGSYIPINKYIIKYFWDNHWSNNNVMLILCGSIASFMVQKIVQSKAMYGRVSGEILLKG